VGRPTACELTGTLKGEEVGVLFFSSLPRPEMLRLLGERSASVERGGQLDGTPSK